MVRRLILATAVSLCLSSQCPADAVRKVHVVDPAEAKVKELQAMAQRHRESARLYRLASELVRKQHQIRIELLYETNQDARKQLQRQVDELKARSQQLQEALRAQLK